MHDLPARALSLSLSLFFFITHTLCHPLSLALSLYVSCTSKDSVCHTHLRPPGHVHTHKQHYALSK
ncbi:hypothetical protein BX666DRAFT_1933172 [Dichotomocladium elegans]|nr:hypothetical protein BX666DRAFT_1933172 [Dichotomocladium elegans]